MANSIDPDQTAPKGTVWSGSTLFAQTCQSKNLGSLWYISDAYISFLKHINLHTTLSSADIFYRRQGFFQCHSNWGAGERSQWGLQWGHATKNYRGHSRDLPRGHLNLYTVGCVPQCRQKVSRGQNGLPWVLRFNISLTTRSWRQDLDI